MPQLVAGIGPLEPNLIIIGDQFIKDLYWLAGWLEGEGSFTICRDGNFIQPRIEFSSTDFDVIEKVKHLLRTNQKIYTRKPRLKQSGELKKPEYYVKIYQSHAIQWMMTLYPLMGIRRKEKIKSIILEWRDYIANGSGKCRKCGLRLQRYIMRDGSRTITRCRFCRLTRRKNA